MLQCCEALAEVHVAEMVHRDLKPGNLFIARLPDGSPTLKILDFGISKQIGGSARELGATTSPQVLGSPFYMAPEQMRADAVDERSDIWALGAILFEMLTGRTPFIGETLPEVYASVLSDTPPPIDTLRKGIPLGLDDVVQRCLEKDPTQRFCDVADLAEALAPFGGGQSVQSVERITRILTNPEPLRARHSTLPPPAPNAPSGATGVVAVGATPAPAKVVGGSSDGRPSHSSEVAFDQGRRSTVVPFGNSSGGAWAVAAPAQDLALLTPGGTPAELNPLSATRSRSPGAPVPRRPARRSVTIVFGAAGVALLVLLWLRADPSRPERPSAGATAASAPAAPDVEPLVATHSAEPPPAPVEAKPAEVEPPALPSVEAPSVEVPSVEVPHVETPSVESPALVRARQTHPAPRGRSPVTSSSSRVGALTNDSAGNAPRAPEVEPAAEPAPPAPTPASPDEVDDFETVVAAPLQQAPRLHSDATHSQDPWNPNSFGDRR
jgi:Protein kinase domain